MKIDLHTHLLPKSWPDWATEYGYGDGRFVRAEPGEDDGKPCIRLMRGDTMFRRVWPNCYDADAVLPDMDRFGIDLQVVSTVPVMFGYWAKPGDGLEIARFLNNDLAEVVRARPERFAALGTLPMQDATLAARELERCIKDLGMPGVQIGSHLEPNTFVGRAHDLNLQAPELAEFWSAAEELGAAVFVHPWEMKGQDQMGEYWLPWLVGMPAETCRAVCCMIFGGIFEKHPKLRVCFAHAGGTFTGTIGRIEHGFNTRPDLVAKDNPINPRQYLKNGERPARFFVDSATHEPKALRDVIDLFGAERVALGSDYPFPLGEHEPGRMIDEMNLDTPTKQCLFEGSACEFLGLTGAHPAIAATINAS